MSRALLVLIILSGACYARLAARGDDAVALGIYDILSAETTPIIWHGELMHVEGRIDTASDQRIHIGGEPLLSNGSQHFRVRRQALLGHGSNDVVVPMIPGSVEMAFCNAHVQQSGSGGALGVQTLWVFGTNNDNRWGGEARSQVHAFWSSDPELKAWNHSVALQLPPGYVAFNTDVTEGPGGYAYMAIELNAPQNIVGNAFTSVFAKAQSIDLSQGWDLLDSTTHVYTKARYSACPTLRYFEEDGYFYMTTLFGNVANHTNGSTPSSSHGRVDQSAGYPCCFVTWLVRSQDLMNWEVSPQNPMMGWPDWSDHVITPGSLLDTLGTTAQKEIGWNFEGKNYSDINRSDQDMVELPESFVQQLGGGTKPGPWTYMVYAAGDQLRMGFGAGFLVKKGMHAYLSSLF